MQTPLIVRGRFCRFALLRFALLLFCRLFLGEIEFSGNLLQFGFRQVDRSDDLV